MRNTAAPCSSRNGRLRQVSFSAGQSAIFSWCIASVVFSRQKATVIAAPAMMIRPTKTLSTMAPCTTSLNTSRVQNQ